MKKIRSSLSKSLGGGCFYLLFFLCVTVGFSAPVELNSLKAVVNGEPITQVDLNEAVTTQVQMYLMENQGQVTAAEAENAIREMEKSALNDLIDRKLILSEFKSVGGKIPEKYVDDAVERFVKGRFEGDRSKFLEQLAKQGLSLNQFREVQRDQIAIQALRSERSKRTGGVGMLSLPEEREAMYEKIKGEFKSEGKVKLRMISIPKMTPTNSMEQQEELINKLRSRIMNGESFAEIAKMYSRDSFAGKGGYVGEISRRGNLNPKLSEIAFSLPTRQVSKPIDDGPSWRLMLIDSKVSGKTPDMEELAEEIEKRIAIEKRQTNMEGWLKKLRRDANVRIY